jgi:hypothetical protein
MDNNTRFELYFKALQQFAARDGHTRVPAIHIEIVDGKEVNLGAWVGYIRQRRKKGLLQSRKVATLETLPGWEWGPLKPGPASDASRNQQILTMRSEGRTLRQIADVFDLSRQRVHQIVKKTNA